MTRILANLADWLARRQHPLMRALAAPLLRLGKRAGSSVFSRNISVMLLGTIAGQALSVLLSPVLTRIYGPTDFGTLAVYMSALNILAGLAALRYEIPMSTAATDEAAANLLALCMGLLALTTAMLGLVALLLPWSLFERIGLAGLDHVRLLIPAGFFFIGAYYVMAAYTTRKRDFESIARTRISQGISGPVSQIVLGLLGGGAWGLALGFIVGQSSGTFLLFKRMVLDQRAAFRCTSVRGVWREAWRHRAFPMISSWASLIDTAGAGQLIYVLVALYYPGSVLGYMFIAERVVARPLAVVSTSLLTVFMGEIGIAMNADPALLRRRFAQVSGQQFLFGATWIVAADLGAWLAFPVVFGRNWADAVPYLLVLSISYLVNSVIGSVNYTLQALGRQALAAAWQTGRVSAIILVFMLSNRYALDALQAVSIYAAVQVAACGLLFVMMKLSVEHLSNRAAVQPA